MRHAGFLKQIGIYLGKCFRIFVSEKGWVSFISTFVIVVLVSCVTGDDMFAAAGATRNGLFALVCACLWVGIFNSIRSVCSERAIIKREHRTGLRISSYVLAHVIYEAVICFGECLIITAVVVIRNRDTISSYGILLPTALELFVDFYLLTLAADVLALMVSCIVHTENMAMTVMPFVLIAEMVFGGVIFTLEGVAETLSAFMISRWGMASLCVTANINSMSMLVEEGNDYTFELANQLGHWGKMGLFIVLFTVLSIFFLSGVDRDKR